MQEAESCFCRSSLSQLRQTRPYSSGLQRTLGPKAKTALAVEATPVGEMRQYAFTVSNEEEMLRTVAKRLPPRGNTTIPSRPVPQNSTLGDHIVMQVPEIPKQGWETSQFVQRLPQAKRKKISRGAAKIDKQRMCSEAFNAVSSCKC